MPEDTTTAPVAEETTVPVTPITPAAEAAEGQAAPMTEETPTPAV